MKRLTNKKLFALTRKNFNLKDFKPLVHIFINYVGRWSVLNISDVKTASCEQLKFMETVLNGENYSCD